MLRTTPCTARLLRILAVFLAACGPLPGGPAAPAGAPDVRLSPEQARLLDDYPDAVYIRGVCLAARDPEAAKVEARADVARQIDAAVTSQIRVIQRSVNDHDLTDILSDVAESSRFGHAHLIEVPPQSVVCHQGSCQALALLHRGNALAFLRPLAQRASDDLRATVQRALGTTGDLPAFTAAFREAEALYRKATPLTHQLRAIGGQAAAGADDDARYASLLRARQDLLAGQRVVVDTADLTAPDLRAPLAAALAGALADLGVPASTGAGCAGSLRLRVTGGVSCQKKFGFHSCGLDAHATLTECPGGRELARARLADPSDSNAFRGADARSPDRATAAIADALHATALARVLRAGLGHALPLR